MCIGFSSTVDNVDKVDKHEVKILFLKGKAENKYFLILSASCGKTQKIHI